MSIDPLFSIHFNQHHPEVKQSLPQCNRVSIQYIEIDMS